MVYTHSSSLSSNSSKIGCTESLVLPYFFLYSTTTTMTITSTTRAAAAATTMGTTIAAMIPGASPELAPGA